MGSSVRAGICIAALALCACGQPPGAPAAADADPTAPAAIATSTPADDFKALNGPICYDDGDEGVCEDYPTPLLTGAKPVALQERPAADAPVIATIAPGESVDALDFMTIRYYAHRGVVRQAGGDLAVGDVVYPSVSLERDSYPFRDWDDPEDKSYTVERKDIYTDVPLKAAGAPLIDWQQVRPREDVANWVQLRRADGTRGWALIQPPCPFEIVNAGECIERAGSEPEAPPTVPNTTHPRLLQTFRANVIFDARFSPDGSRIITSGVENAGVDAQPVIEREWNAATGAFIAIVPPASRTVKVDGGIAKVLAADGRVLVSVSDERSPINNAVLASDGKHLGTLSDNYTASLWDIATGKRIFTFGGRFDRLGAVRYTPDGARIFTWGGADPADAAEEPTRIWDAASGRLLNALPVFSKVSAFSADSAKFAIMEWDRITLYETATAKAVSTITIDSRHEPFHSVAFSPDGKQIVTGDPWSTATVWEAATGKVVLKLSPFDPAIPGVRTGPAARVINASFSPDGRRILTTGRGIAQLWEAPRF